MMTSVAMTTVRLLAAAAEDLDWGYLLLFCGNCLRCKLDILVALSGRKSAPNCSKLALSIYLSF